MAAVARVREQLGIDVESMWTDDGFVVRFPEQDEPPDPAVLIPAPEELETLLIRQLGQSALFAARFRENASRALLLPRRRPGQRTPLWLQRKRAADLLAVAAQFTSFPILLETYRECLRDVFDLPALHTLLRDVQSRTLRVVQLDSDTPSPFSSTLLFGFVANYIYDGDAPLAERRAQALSIDQAQLRELLGEAELRDLLDADALTALEAQLQLLDPRYKIRNLDALHDALLRIGDLDEAEIAARCSEPSKVAEWTERLTATRRALWVKLGSGEARRLIAVEDAARFRDALGVVLPPGLPDALLAPAHHPLRDLLLRYARTHAPFTVQEVAARYGLGRAIAQAGLTQLVAEGKLHEGAFRPGGIHREYVHAEVLRTLRQRSLAKLRKEVEPVEPPVFGRFCTQWHGTLRPRAGLDAILDAVEKLQGVPLPASILESEILRARVLGYRPSDLDSLSMAGEIVWCGREPLGERDGRISLYLTDHFPKLWVPPVVELDAREQRIVDLLAERGASFFAAIQAALGGFPGDALDTLWGLVWKGIVTNDTFRALRAHVHGAPDRSHPRRGGARGFRSRRQAPRAAEGRWSLVRERSGEVFVAASSAPAAAASSSTSTERAAASAPTEREAASDGRATATERAAASGSASTCIERAAASGKQGASAERAAVSGRQSAAAATRTATERSAALAETLLQRYGVVTREVASAEGIAGGFSAVYDVFKALEEAGRIRRGYFVSGVSAMQFALPGVLEQLRALRREPDAPEVVHLAATDPANPYGALLKWPEAAQGRSLARAAHALVILIDGALAAYLARGGKTMQVFLPEEEPDRTHVARALAARLKLLASTPERGGLAIAEIDGQPAEQHPIGAELREAGFLPSKQGFYLPRSAREQILPLVAADGDLDPGADSDAPEAENA
jgi:ATP-dependent Lhr-like helicase